MRSMHQDHLVCPHLKLIPQMISKNFILNTRIVLKQKTYRNTTQISPSDKLHALDDCLIHALFVWLCVGNNAIY
jgi:hypothetical protein